MTRLLICLALALAGLAQAQPRVVATLSPYASLLEQLLGDGGEVLTLLPPGASPHTYSPTPQAVTRLAQADLIVMNGGLDAWLAELVVASGSRAPVLVAMETLAFEPLSGAEAEGGVNPHLWLDPLLMAQLAPKLAAALAAVDPANAERYRERGEALAAELERLNAELETLLAPVAGAAFVPFHDAWPYFARRYGLDLVAEIEPSPGREPSARYLAEALAKIRSSGAKAIFSDAQLPRRPAEVVAEQAGLPLYVLDPEGSGGAQSYQEMMLTNARTIAAALSGGAP